VTGSLKPGHAGSVGSVGRDGPVGGRQGSWRIRRLRNSTGEPSDSRHRKPLAGEQPVPPETSSPFTHRRTSPLMART